LAISRRLAACSVIVIVFMTYDCSWISAYSLQFNEGSMRLLVFL